MTRNRPTLAIVAAALVPLLGATTALAQRAPQLSRTCVSAARGDDANGANSCDCSTPCRTFQVAHNLTAPEGELMVLDAGGYGALTIGKSISIVNDGVGEASILVSGGGTGITINAPAATGYVNLRGLTIQGVSGGTSTGLRFNSGVALTMTNCVIRNHTGNGVEFFPTASSELAMADTLVSDNGGHGILVQPVGGTAVKTAFHRVQAHNNSQNGFTISNPVGGLALRGTRPPARRRTTAEPDFSLPTSGAGPG